MPPGRTVDHPERLRQTADYMAAECWGLEAERLNADVAL